MCENNFELKSPELCDTLLSDDELETVEEAARAQCEHLTLAISSINRYFQEKLGDPRLPWCRHWLVETVEGVQFCYPIREEEEYDLYSSGSVPDWGTVDCYMFQGKYYQVFFDNILRHEHLENSPNRELSVYKSSLKQIEELGKAAISAAAILKNGLT